MKILVCGDRNWTDKTVISKVLSQYLKDTILVHGACRGADLIGAEVAVELGWSDIRPYPANWKAHGRAAGPVRNKQMYETERPDRVLAFHDNLAESKGTANMVEIAKKGNTPVEVYIHDTSTEGYSRIHLENNHAEVFDT